MSNLATVRLAVRDLASSGWQTPLRLRTVSSFYATITYNMWSNLGGVKALVNTLSIGKCVPRPLFAVRPCVSLRGGTSSLDVPGPPDLGLRHVLSSSAVSRFALMLSTALGALVARCISAFIA